MTKKLVSFDDEADDLGLPTPVAGRMKNSFSPRLSIAASPATGVKVTSLGSGIRPINYINGVFIGFRASRLYTSSDADTWTDAGPVPGDGYVRKILPTDDGEMLLATSGSLHRSTGWATGTPTWSQKMATTGAAVIQPFSFNGRAGKFIVTEYAGTRADSRYAYISTDDGNTFTQVWDANVMHGEVDGPLTHIHGVEYDHYADRFYLSEGHHPASAGIYVSEDDGATWMRPPGLFEDPAPTTIDVTPDGLVCSSDSQRPGLFGVVRQDDPMDEKLIHTWRWQTGKDGVVGFGASSFRDEKTGVVYVGFRSGQDGVHPVIAGGTPTSAGLVWQWDGGPSVVSDDVQNPLVADGRLYAYGLLSGELRQIRGNIPAPGVPLPDPSGDSTSGTSLRVGHGAVVAGAQGTAVGVAARADGAQDSTAVGYGAVASVNAVAVGSSSTAGGSSVAIGHGATPSAGGNGVAIGNLSSTSGGGSVVVGDGAKAGGTATAIGWKAEAGTSSAAVGTDAKAAVSSVAMGRRAKADAGDASVAIGVDAVATAGWGTAVGSLASGASSSAALGREANAGLSAVAVGRASAATTSGVAVGREAQAGNQMTAVGYQAKATAVNSVALGQGTTTTEANAVAVGSRSLHLQPVTAAPIAPSTGAVLYVRDVDGVMSLCCRIAGGAEIIIAPTPAA